jgi:predicted PurR-regulated permease PerM
MKPDKAKSGPPATPAERTFVRRVLIVIALVALAFLLWQLRSVLLMLFGAVVVGTIVRAVAEPIAKWTRMPDGIAVAVAALLIAGVIVGLVWMMGSQVSAQFKTLTSTLPESWAKLEHWVQGLGFGEPLRNWQRAMEDGGGSGIVSRVSGLALSFTSAFGNVLIVIFGGIFLAAEPQFYRTGAIKLVPQAKRALVAEAMDESEKALRLWLKGQLMAMIVVGAMTWFGLWLIGVESPLVLGLLAGALEFIPFAGPIIAAFPGIMLALAQSTDLALWAAGVYLIVQHSEAYLIQPLIQQYAVDLPAVILLFSLLAFGLLFGTLGVVLAAPLAVVSYVLVKRLYVVETLETPTPIPGEGKSG